MISLFLASGKVDPGQSYDDSNLLAHAAGQLENLELVNLLLATGRSNPGFVNKSGWTPLMYAAETGRKESKDICRAILATGQSNPVNIANPRQISRAEDGVSSIQDMDMDEKLMDLLVLFLQDNDDYNTNL